MARLRSLPKSSSSVYRARARQYRRQLERSLETRDWDAIGLTAVHLGIAAADAVTVARLGNVWAGQDHRGAVDLLSQVGDEGVDGAVAQLRLLLEMKTRVEYGAESVTATRAAELARRAIRVFEWAEEALG